jgi:hypothetical protein
VTVRLGPDERRSSTETAERLVALELVSGVVRSLAAERCGADGAVTVTAKPLALDRCTAALHDRDGARVRRLSPLATPDTELGAPAGEDGIRWRIGADDLPAGATVRVTCRPPGAGEGE